MGGNYYLLSFGTVLVKAWCSNIHRKREYKAQAFDLGNPVYISALCNCEV
jgi:hypothetical protein